MDNTLKNECAPVKSVQELFDVQLSPPTWTSHIIPLKRRSGTAIQNDTLDCHHVGVNDGNGLVPKRYDMNLIPRTVVCHDMKNGYLEDRYIDAQDIGNGYTFYMWQQIDMFIYFSHHFITIPPVHWINLAHKNGVKILGTIITEWQEGEALCNEFLKDQEAMNHFIDAIVAITCIYKLDGWLINIENKIANVGMLLQFVKILTYELHVKSEDSVVLWYDSVIHTGELKWQNELNSLNSSFFDACDGIFLNYTWTLENLMNTYRFAQHRSLDVYVGIDVFGRNTPYKPGYDCYKGVKKARQLNLSVALFAPGWTHESLESEPSETFFQRFIENDRVFWSILWPYLYTHPVNDLFDTNFDVGANHVKYNLSSQQLQLTHISCAEGDYKCVSEMRNRCDCLQLIQSKCGKLLNAIKQNPVTMNQQTMHHLLATAIPLRGQYVLYVVTEQGQDLDIVLMLQELGRMKMVTCHSIFYHNMADADESHIQCVEPKDMCHLVEDVYYDCSAEPRQLRCYMLNFKVQHKLLHIYARFLRDSNVVLNGIGIRKLK